MSNINSPKETFFALTETAEKKANLSFVNMSILGFLAGAYIAFGSYLFTTVYTGSVDALGYGFSKFLGGAMFSVGLMLVLVAGAELFTGNMLILLGKMQKKLSWLQFGKNLLIVYLANFVGSVVVALMIYYSGVNGEGEVLSDVGTTALKIAEYKAELGFVPALLRGILANWLVCLAVVLAAAAKDVPGKIFACLFPIMAFVAMGFEHSVANMFFLPSGLLLSQNVHSTLELSGVANNLVAVTVGNMIGGLIFVALLYWAVYLRNERK
ncbi:formate/nitrite transporter family protein [Candidatus Dojkabacteria bacterium]|nr:formate/nitrite transporter family protein [Candidatus Dojkabacteria bacterium]